MDFRLKLTFMSCLSTLLVLGCDAAGGRYDPANDVVSINSTLGPAGEVPEALISNLDTSDTLAAIQRGVDPTRTLIDTDFACYDSRIINYNEPTFSMNVVGNRFSVGGVSGAITTLDGSDEDFSLAGGPFSAGVPIDVWFNRHGQSFIAETTQGVAHCFQYGASVERAFHRFLLNTPEEGTFDCANRGEGADVQITLFNNGSYSAAGGFGQFRYSNIIAYGQATIDFTDGPLNGDRVLYFEDANTGQQRFRILESETFGFAVGSSTEVTFDCMRLRTPRPYKLYGLNAASLPALPHTPLAGMYLVEDRDGGRNAIIAYARYYDFTPDGYTAFNTPSPYGRDCSRTAPNGLNFCGHYTYDGHTLQRFTNFGKSISSGSAQTDSSGDLQKMYGDSAERIQALASQPLDGDWENVYFRSSGCDDPVSGYCSYTERRRSYTFNSNGEFRYSYVADGYTGSVTPVGSAIAASSDRESKIGTYEIQGNWLVTTEYTGRIEYQFIAQTHSDVLAIEGLLLFFDFALQKLISSMYTRRAMLAWGCKMVPALM